MPGHREPRRARMSRDRTFDTEPTRKRILIFCEGEKTEPNYFEGLIETFKLSSVDLTDGRTLDITVDGGKKDTLRLVESAKAQQKVVGGRLRYDEIWCVFDKDSFGDDNFDNAIHKTEATSVQDEDGRPWLKAAWSNQSFELWYVLHFEYIESAPVRKQTPNMATARRYYCDRLDELLPGCSDMELTKYSKGIPDFCQKLGVDRLKVAVRNARRLLHSYETDYERLPPYHDRIPATTVHELVCSLLAHTEEGRELCR
jgi:hypothetical protein